MNISELLIADNEKINLDDLVLDEDNLQTIQQLMNEHKFASSLQEYGLPVSNKILLTGHSGCGKTSTAKAIATSLNKKISILNLSNVVNARIGETAQNLKQVFDKAAIEKSVLLLDEFDQIAKPRNSDDKDVGEMRRLVNSIIQLIDYLPANTILVAATNHIEMIDHALIRRFQIRLNFSLPTRQTLDEYYNNLLLRFPDEMKEINRRYDISFAEAKDHLYSSVKARLINSWLSF